MFPLKGRISACAFFVQVVNNENTQKIKKSMLSMRFIQYPVGDASRLCAESPGSSSAMLAIRPHAFGTLGFGTVHPQASRPVVTVSYIAGR